MKKSVDGLELHHSDTHADGKCSHEPPKSHSPFETNFTAKE